MAEISPTAKFCDASHHKKGVILISFRSRFLILQKITEPFCFLCCLLFQNLTANCANFLPFYSTFMTYMIKKRVKNISARCQVPSFQHWASTSRFASNHTQLLQKSACVYKIHTQQRSYIATVCGDNGEEK